MGVFKRATLCADINQAGMNPVNTHLLGSPAFGPLIKTDHGYKLQHTEFNAESGVSPCSDGSLRRRPAWEVLDSNGSSLQEGQLHTSAASLRREATPPRQSTPRRDSLENEEGTSEFVGSFPGVVKETVGFGNFFPPERKVSRRPVSPWPEPPWPGTATTTASASSPLPTGAIDSVTHSSTPGAEGADSETGDRLRSKLLDMGTSFLGFDKVVEEDTMRRRQVEHQRVQEVLDGLARLEKRLNVETKRRLEANTNSQEVMDKLLSDMLIRIQGRILDRFELLSQSVESLFTRLLTLERGIQQFKGELPSNLQVETATLFQAIRELNNNFQDDRRQRLETDQFLLRRIEESDCNVDVRIEQELVVLERCAEAIQGDLEEFSAEAETPVPSKWVGLLENLAQMRGSIAKEAQRRETVDDQVVQAINQYTSALQRTLSISNM